MCALIQIILVFSALVYQVSAIVIAVTDGHGARYFLTLESSTVESVIPNDVTKFGPSIEKISYNGLSTSMEPRVRKRHKNHQPDNEVYVIVSMTTAEKENGVFYSSWKLAKYFRIKTLVGDTSTVEVTETHSGNTRTAHMVTINGCTWGQVTYKINSLTRDAANLGFIQFESNDPNIEIKNSETGVYIAFLVLKV